MTTTGSPRDAAFLFASNGDWARAVPAARQALASDPEDAVTLALLSLGLANLNRPADAVNTGRRAVGVDPESGFAHYALGRALLAHDDVSGAERSARQALRLDPDADAYALLGQVHVRRRRWSEALEAAEQGLAIDPEHSGCANLRVMALGSLGRGEEAERVVREALAADPENAATHANHGWQLLRQQKHDEALESFRVALRLDPTLDWARAGILEALKARNGLYRLMLRYAMWMSTLDARSRWFVLLGLFFGSRIARSALRDNPEWWPVLGPALALYAVFALSTWLAEPLSNLLLRLNPFGRLVLDKPQILASNLVGACLGVALAAGLVGVLTSAVPMFVTAAVAFLLLVPISGAFSAYDTRAWRFLSGALVVLALTGVATAGLSYLAPDLAVWPFIALAVGSFGFGWAANWASIKFS